MSEQTPGITAKCRVTLHYALSLADGTQVVSTFDEAPLTFSLGDGTMETGLEQALVGLACGAEEQIILSGDEVFGERSDEKIQQLSLEQFPAEMALTPGQVIAFTTPGGDEVPGQVLEIQNEQVTVDFNHPLSGHIIGFRVKILAIEPLADH